MVGKVKDIRRRISRTKFGLSATRSTYPQALAGCRLHMTRERRLCIAPGSVRCEATGHPACIYMQGWLRQRSVAQTRCGPHERVVR